jgi:hypothetical protein
LLQLAKTKEKEMIQGWLKKTWLKVD